MTRQGCYKHTKRANEEDVLISSVVWHCQYVRVPDNLPKAGCRELHELCKRHFGVKFTPGRDRFYDMFRANGMMLRKKRRRPRTTDSSHGNRIYPDLPSMSPKLVAKAPGRLVVCDITYVYCMEGFGYLFLAAAASIDNAVTMYNRARPHQGIGMKTPYEMMTGKADNPLLAKKNDRRV